MGFLTMYCAECGDENPVKANYCMNCGMKLKPTHIICPKCSFENLTFAKYCIQCGENLTLNPTPKTSEILNHENNKNTDSTQHIFTPKGSLNDFRSDLDLIKIFYNEMKQWIKTINFKIKKDADIYSNMYLKLDEVEKEIKLRKMELDKKFKVLNSDVIKINIKGGIHPVKINFLVNVDRKKLNQYVEYYKKQYNK